MNICCWSGGEDSTATVILAHELNIPLDMIIFSEVMFDKNTSGEDVRHIDFIKKVCIPRFESWGYEVKILRSDITYLDNFYTVVEKPTIHKDNANKYRGFPVSGACSIQRECKKKPINDFLKTLDEDCHIYLGICVDEQRRLKSMHKDERNVSLLEMLGYTKSMTGPLCDEFGLRSPIYRQRKQKRGGCWFCPWAKDNELLMAKEAYPEAFRKFVSLEEESDLCGTRWNPYNPKRLKDFL